jgi:hypothetical protein
MCWLAGRRNHGGRWGMEYTIQIVENGKVRYLKTFAVEPGKIRPTWTTKISEATSGDFQLITELCEVMKKAKYPVRVIEAGRTESQIPEVG